MSQDGCSYESIDQPLKGFLLRLLPVVSDQARLLTILHAAKQLMEWPCYASKIINELSVKVAESKEDLDVVVCLKRIITLFQNGFDS